MRGGKRAGSGRKSKEGRRVMVRVTPRVAAVLGPLQRVLDRIDAKLKESGIKVAVSFDGGKTEFGTLVDGKVYVSNDARWWLGEDGVCRPIWQIDGPSVYRLSVIEPGSIEPPSGDFET